MKKHLTAALFLLTAASPLHAQWTNGPVSYTYDPSGNIRSIATDQYRYDGAGRLVSATTNGTQQLYTYDVYGNSTDSTPVDTPTNRIAGASYDSAGNLLAWDNHTYAYDTVGMMTSAVGNGSEREFLYTVDDERIAVHHVSNVTNVSPWWQWTIRGLDAKVLRDLTSTGGTSGLVSWTWTRDSIWRDGQLLASKQKLGNTVTTYAYHLDHLGTPRVVTTPGGSIVGVHNYYPFGGEAPGGITELQSSTHRFTGHERDAVANDPVALDYMHARYYSAAVGRFLSVDPVVDLKAATAGPQLWNRYAYVRNNPLRFVDPNGRLLKTTGTDLDKNRELELVQKNLHQEERALVSLKGSVIVVQPGAKGFSVAFNDLRKLADPNTKVTELHIAQSATEIKCGACKPQQIDLRTTGGGLTVLPAYSRSGNTEVYLDSRVNSQGVPDHIVFGHELFGHALDILLIGTSSEAAAIAKENQLRYDQGMPLRSPP